MKKVSSLKSLKNRKDCKVVTRGKRKFVICPTNPKFKAVQK